MAMLADRIQGERVARIALSMIAEPGDPDTGFILARHGAVETLRLIESDESVSGLPRADGLMWRERLAGRVSTDLLDRIGEAEQNGYGAVIPSDVEWPVGLDDLGDRAPYVLWVRGAKSLLMGPLRARVTITGSRAATHYGERITADIAANLAEDDRIIVAGGGFGIEGAAHRAVLAAGGQTIAVLAGGLDRAYPAAHRDLLGRISDVGLLVSELPPGAAPSRQRFVARGRLLAALSGATVVPEAGLRSGALNTARHAYALGRGVAAVPGPVTSAVSAGVHDLVKRGIAAMVTETSDITSLLDSGLATRHGPIRPLMGEAFTYRRAAPGAPGRSI